MKTYCGRGCKSRRASARSMARLVVAPLAFAVLLFAMVRNAYAEVDWHEKNDTMSATVAPWNYPDGRAYALAEFLGYDWGSLSVEVQESIMTDSNGDNAFTQMYEHNVLNVQYERGEGAFNWPIINLWSTLFGLDKMWDINVSRTRYNQAKEVMEKWMFPSESEGGGSGGGEDEDGYSVVGQLNSGDIAEEFTLYYTGNGSDAKGDTLNVTFKNDSAYESVNNMVKNRFDDGTHWMIHAQYESGGSYFRVYADAFSSDMYIRYKDNKLYDIYNYGDSTVNGTWIRLSFDITGSDIVISGLYGTSGTYTVSAKHGRDFRSVSYITNGAEGDGGDGGGYEPTPKPEPTRPQLPNITINTTNNNTSNYDYSDRSTHVKVDLPDISIQPDFDVDPNSRSPVVDVSLDPTINVTASGDDVIPWLEAILNAINDLRYENREDFNKTRENIILAMNMIKNAIDDLDVDLVEGMGLIYDYMGSASELMHEDLDAIGDQIDQTGDDISQNIGSVVTNRISWLADNLVENINALDSDILSELHSDAKYIVDNLEFDATYDDSTLITWLKKIYGKLSKNPSGIPDVTTDPDGWTDAIEDLIRKLLEGLVGAANVAELAQMMNELQDRFPISIPWDLMAIVTLFSGEAVTPQYDFPIYFGSQHITDISIDLTPYEEVGRVSRIMSLLIFACMLLLETKNLLRTSSVVTRKAG